MWPVTNICSSNFKASQIAANAGLTTRMVAAKAFFACINES
jgi:hypothetical protein